MTARLPLVIGSNGLPQQLQTSDTLARGGGTPAPGSASQKLSLSSSLQTNWTYSAESINVFDFGAIGNGFSNPLSSVYSSLAAAQAVYPWVDDLTPEVDYCAIQSAIDYAFNNRFQRTSIPKGGYFISAPIYVDPPNSLRAQSTNNTGSVIIGGNTYNRVGRWDPIRIFNQYDIVQYNGLPFVSLVGSNKTITLTGSIANNTNVLTVTAPNGALAANMNLTGKGVLTGLFIVGQLTGPAGGAGTYELNQTYLNGSIGPVAMVANTPYFPTAIQLNYPNSTNYPNPVSTSWKYYYANSSFPVLGEFGSWSPTLAGEESQHDSVSFGTTIFPQFIGVTAVRNGPNNGATIKDILLDFPVVSDPRSQVSFTAKIDNGSGGAGTTLTVTAVRWPGFFITNTMIVFDIFGVTHFPTKVVTQLTSTEPGGIRGGRGTYQVDFSQNVAPLPFAGLSRYPNSDNGIGSYGGQDPATVGFSSAAVNVGSSRTTFENLCTINAYTNMKFGEGPIALGDSNLVRRCLGSNTYYGVLYAESQAYINEIYDSNLNAIVGVSGRPVSTYGGNWSTENEFSLASGYDITAANFGASFTAKIDNGSGGAGTILTVTGPVTGTIAQWQTVNGAGVAAFTYITGQLTGATGGAGTYAVNNSLNVSSEAMTTVASSRNAGFYQFGPGLYNFDSSQTTVAFSVALTAPDANFSTLALRDRDGVWNAFAMVTDHFGPVPLLRTGYSTDSQIVSFIIFPPWMDMFVGAHDVLGLTDLQNELAAATTLYAAIMNFTFNCEVAAWSPFLENFEAPTCLISSGGLGPSIISGAFFDYDPTLSGANPTVTSDPAQLARYYVQKAFPFILTQAPVTLESCRFPAGDLLGIRDSVVVAGTGKLVARNSPFQNMDINLMWPSLFGPIGGGGGEQYAVDGLFSGSFVGDVTPFFPKAPGHGLWTTNGGATPVTGTRPANWTIPPLLPADLATLANSVALPPMSTSSIPYPLIYGSQIYQTADLSTNGKYLLQSSHKYYSFFQDLTVTNNPNLAWHAKGQTWNIYLDSDTLTIMFSGMVFGIFTDQLCYYVVTGINYPLGYVTVYNLTTGSPGQGPAWISGNKNTIYTGAGGTLVLHAQPYRIQVMSGPPVYLNATANAIVGQEILADTTSGAWTLTLPPTTVNGGTALILGDEIIIQDITSNFVSAALTLNPNGGKINSSSSNLVLNAAGGKTTKLNWLNTIVGWVTKTY